MGIFNFLKESLKEEFEFQKRISNKKNKISGKPKHFIFEQPGYKVLLLPAKFANHSLRQPKFSSKEQQELGVLFKRNKVKYCTYEEYSHPTTEFVFLCRPISQGEVFYADENDLNNIPGEVCEFEFHKKTT
jgi:hypothetical protein